MEMRSDATSNRCSPASKSSRTLPEPTRGRSSSISDRALVTPTDYPTGRTPAAGGEVLGPDEEGCMRAFLGVLILLFALPTSAVRADEGPALTEPQAALEAALRCHDGAGRAGHDAV